MGRKMSDFICPRHPGMSDQVGEPALKRSIAKTLKAFHHFLVQEYQLPTRA